MMLKFVPRQYAGVELHLKKNNQYKSQQKNNPQKLQFREKTINRNCDQKQLREIVYTIYKIIPIILFL